MFWVKREVVDIPLEEDLLNEEEEVEDEDKDKERKWWHCKFPPDPLDDVPPWLVKGTRAADQVVTPSINGVVGGISSLASSFGDDVLFSGSRKRRQRVTHIHYHHFGKRPRKRKVDARRRTRNTRSRGGYAQKSPW